MEFKSKEIKRLGNLSLDLYAGNLEAIQGEDTKKYRKLMETSVKIKLIPEAQKYDERIYTFLKEFGQL